jgi:opacity protein-like surface antigen
MKRIALAVALVIVASAAPAAAAPNPNPNAPAHTGTACANVLANNPNTGPDGHISDVGGQHFSDVGAAMCGLPG